MDRYYTSVELGYKLLQQNLTMVGTMKINRRHIPPVMKKPQIEVEDTCFAFQDKMMLAVWRAKPEKYILMASTFHSQPVIPATEDNPSKKPEVILEYNRTKAGVDAIDLLISTCSGRSRLIHRWPVVIFTMLIDVAAINAYAILNYHDPPTQNQKKGGHRRKFVERLALSLILPQVERRAAAYERGEVGGLQAHHLLALGAVLERDIVPRPPPGARRPVHNHDDMPDDAPKTRCHVCVSAQVRGQRVTSRATKQCPICRRKMCRAHAVEICCNCNELEQFDD